MQELSKSQKKVARELIQKSLQKDCDEFLKETEELLADFKKGTLSSHDNYLKLYSKIEKFDNYVAKRYNNITGSKYLPTVLGLFADEVLNERDLDGLGEELKAKIIVWKKMCDE